jgi:hypothetical protein
VFVIGEVWDAGADAAADGISCPNPAHLRKRRVCESTYSVRE